MAHTEKCPVCKGSGQLITSNFGTTSLIPITKTCHGCVGLGWVTVQDEIPPLLINIEKTCKSHGNVTCLQNLCF
jgi:hypothetical protein